LTSAALAGTERRRQLRPFLAARGRGSLAPAVRHAHRAAARHPIGVEEVEPGARTAVDPGDGDLPHSPPSPTRWVRARRATRRRSGVPAGGARSRSSGLPVRGEQDQGEASPLRGARWRKRIGCSWPLHYRPPHRCAAYPRRW
jgi:hypothetical protein